MTIKQLHELTPANQKIYIGWDGSIQELDRENAIELHAYGPYLISKLSALAENKIEAVLMFQPVKE